MTVFTKEVMRNYRSSMLKEMEEVAKKYGVKVEFGNIRFNATDFRVKMEAKSINSIVAAPTSSNATSSGPISIGSMINHPARKTPLIVKEITPRGSVIVVSNRGTRYRIKMSEAIKYAA